MKLSKESKKYLNSVVEEEFEVALLNGNDARDNANTAALKLYDAFLEELEALKKEFKTKVEALVDRMDLTWVPSYNMGDIEVKMQGPYNQHTLERWAFVETAADQGAVKSFSDALEQIYHARARSFGRVALITDASKGADGVEDTARKICREELDIAQRNVRDICEEVAEAAADKAKRLVKKQSSKKGKNNEGV